MAAIRPYRHEDYEAVCRLLVVIFEVDRARPLWLPFRWEYMVYNCGPLQRRTGATHWEETTSLWEVDGKLVGVVNSEEADTYYHIHTLPEYRFLEEDMLLWAEDNIRSLPVSTEGLIGFHDTYADDSRRTLYMKHGYRKQPVHDYLNWRSLRDPIPVVELPNGYDCRPIRDRADLLGRLECSARAWDTTPRHPDDYELYRAGPSYKPEYDIITERDGQVTSYTTVWTDRGLSMGFFEPVAVHPDHQGKGLGRAMLNHCLRKLKSDGFEWGYVGAYGDGLAQFYNKSGFTEFFRRDLYQKRLT